MICTHLHLDHGRWNTMMQHGRRVPTFSNARYLLSRREWEHWSQSKEKRDRLLMEDSVRPVHDAGLVGWIVGGHQVTSEISTEFTPGHSPGHMAVRIRPRGHEGVATGGLIHAVGRYYDGFERAGGRWRFKSRICDVEWPRRRAGPGAASPPTLGVTWLRPLAPPPVRFPRARESGFER